MRTPEKRVLLIGGTVKVIEFFIGVSGDRLIFVLRIFGFFKTCFYTEVTEEARDVSDLFA